jgi:hypothetical protein
MVVHLITTMIIGLNRLLVLSVIVVVCAVALRASFAIVALPVTSFHIGRTGTGGTTHWSAW